ncbi:MAG: mechanosensitive ion channel [Brumimicrobium sp.]|nr:mechanosensitive ion channel [Brumimicrobium sp.]
MTFKRPKYRIGVYIIFAISVLILHYLLNLEIFSSLGSLLPFLKKLTLSLFIITIIFAISRIASRIIDKETEVEGDRYNLHRITNLLTVILIFIVVIAFLFQNLYAAAVSFGLISLVLGFALQAPITSFIAWVYIVFRRPYQVGNRIQIEGKRGDVIEIGYLDTTILECSGEYLDNDRSSGRIIRFPNSIILKAEVINYSGPQEPFIWNETPIQIAYTSDLKFVEGCLLAATMEDFKERYSYMIPHELEKWEPAVYFRVNQYAWLEAVVQYPVEPEDTTGRRTRILQKALPLLNAQPNKVMFPEGTNR